MPLLVTCVFLSICVVAQQPAFVGKTCGMEYNIILKCDVIWENLSHGAKLIFWVIGTMWKYKSGTTQNVHDIHSSSMAGMVKNPRWTTQTNTPGTRSITDA